MSGEKKRLARPEDCLRKKSLPQYQLIGFDQKWIAFPPVLNAVAHFVFRDIGYPALKSEVVLVVNKPERDSPMYVAGGPIETILLVLEGNLPWKFGYQLAHELGHMSARGDLRHPREDGLLWIEEMLCEAHSLIAMRYLTIAGPLPQKAVQYELDLLVELPHQPVGPGWWQQNCAELEAALGLTTAARHLARHVFARLPPRRIVADNRALLTMPMGLPLPEFLNRWRQVVGDGSSVPMLLQELTGAD